LAAENQNDMDDVEDLLQGSFANTFGWIIVVNRLTENDITKHKLIYEMNVVEVLNQLSYVIAWDQEQIKAQKKMMSQV
jgi:hypothetical protein